MPLSNICLWALKRQIIVCISEQLWFVFLAQLVVRRESSTIPLNISPKPLGQFWPNLAGMFLGRSSLKNVHRIRQECFLVDLFQKLFRKLWTVNKHGCGEWGLHEEIIKKSSFLKPLVWFWNNFTEMFFRWPFQNVFAKFWSVDKHGSGEWGLLALCGHEEILENSFSLKPQKKSMVL